MKKILLLTGCVLTLALGAEEYTLARFLEAGINHSYAVRQKAVMLKNSDLEIRNAAWNLLPSADASFRRLNTEEHYQNSGSLVISRSLSLNEPTYFSYRQAKLDKKMAELDWRQARKQIVYDIYSAWLDLAQLDNEIALRRENLSLLQKIKQQTELQFNLGQRTALDVTQAEINVINAQLSITDLQNRFASQRAALFQKVGLPDDGSELRFGAPETDTPAPDFNAAPTETLLLARQKYDLKKSRLDKRQMLLGLLPSLNLSASYGQYSRTENVLDFSGYDDSYTLALTLGWSLWTPLTKGSKYGQIANTLTLKEWQLEEAETSLQLERDNLKREWDYLQASLRLNERKAAQASENLRIAREKYELGTLSLIELEQARINALEAGLAVSDLRFRLQKTAQQWNLLNSLPLLDRY